LLLFFMGGVQGLLGWYMVKSGLVDDPKVSQYRLTAHLGVAVAIYGGMLWVIFGLLFGTEARREHPRLVRWALWLCGLVFLMILSGGLVAGTRAGFAFNTWPLMGAGFLPPGLYAMEPGWLSAFEDLGTVQFNHRIFAYLLILLVGGFSFAALRRGIPASARIGIYLLLTALTLQVVLGISTLLMKVPVSLGAAHQGGAVLLLSAAVYTAHRLGRG
jgi:cytochrome c oxidase assembly protein subunit 15